MICHQPRAALRALALVSALGWCGCGSLEEPTPYDTLRVVVDTDVTLPGDLDTFALSVERGGASLFAETYGAEVLGALPDSIVLVNEHATSVSPDQEIFTVPRITVTVVGYLGDQARVWRSADVRFNRGQYELPLPICTVCLDQHCEAGTTCKRGECVDASIGSVADLPEGDGQLVDSLADCGP